MCVYALISWWTVREFMDRTVKAEKCEQNKEKKWGIY